VPGGASICARPDCVSCRPLAEWVVAARIQDHEVDRVAGRIELLHHGGEVQGRERHLVLARDVGIDGHQVVAPAHLQAMPGEEEDAGGRAPQLVAELA
jgi:hypothetical protein